MAFKWVDGGRNFFENAIVGDSFTNVINTIAIGDDDSAPNNSDTSLGNNLYEADTSSPNVTFERGTGTGEIRATIEFTGGTEVPADSDIIEFGFKSDVETLVYREVRSQAISVGSGETKIVEIRAFIKDAVSDGEQVITDVGREFIADRVIDLSTDKMNVIAIGSGTGTVSGSDTTLSNELYRASDSNSNTTITTTTNIGDVQAEITISAGSDSDDEVDAGATISEFGLITGSGDTLVLHEKRTGLTLENNDTKTFKIPFDIIQ